MHDDVFLILDRDRAVRDSLCFTLHLCGARSQAFASPAALFASPGLRHANFILLGHEPGALDGPKIAATLRRLGVRAELILLSDGSDPLLPTRARRAGIRHLFESPDFGGALFAHISDLLNTPAHNAPSPVGIHA